MVTIENATWFFLTLIPLFITVYLVIELKSNKFVLRENQLELETKQLIKRITALQETIDILSNRITELQEQVSKLKDENERLRNDLGRYLLPTTNWKANELSAIRNALGKLSADEFKHLAFERFRTVYDGFGADQTLQAQRLILVEYADNHNQLNLLKASIMNINHAAFDG